MQNKSNCGCNGGFVPVSGNWDFNHGDCGCQQNDSRRTNRRGNRSCGDCETAYTRERDCQCERCDDARQVECCDQNTYVREMDACECKGNNGYARSSGCTHDDDCQCENCTRNRSRNRSNDCDECNGSSYNRSRSGNYGYDKDNSAYNRNRSNDCGCDKNGSTYNRNRSNDCGCDKNGSTYNRNRSNGCGCDKDNTTTYARSNKNRTVGMINVERQEIDEIFESESALRAGTLFPELHKPMNGYCPYDGNCGTCKQQAAFAAWELRLYLNTHPNDKEALALFRKLCKEAEEPNYATSFLTDDGCSNGWDWIKNPWPWEYDCHCGD